MLCGSYKHNVDKKGRVSIPFKHREKLGSTFMICCGIFGARCLCAYPMENWEELVEKINTLPQAKSSSVKRFLFSGTFEVEPDAQGRILLPQALREYANIKEEAEFLGVGKYVEIWNSEMCDKTLEDYKPEDMAAVMQELNF